MTHLDACLSCPHCTVDHARPERSLCRANVIAVGNGYPAAAYCVDTIEREQCIRTFGECACCGEIATKVLGGAVVCDDCFGEHDEPLSYEEMCAEMPRPSR